MRVPDAQVEFLRAVAIDLRATGLSYRTIGRALQIDKSTAHEMCNPTMRATYNQRRLARYRDHRDDEVDRMRDRRKAQR